MRCPPRVRHQCGVSTRPHGRVDMDRYGKGFEFLQIIIVICFNRADLRLYCNLKLAFQWILSRVGPNWTRM
jgi:hypothetical protein